MSKSEPTDNKVSIQKLEKQLNVCPGCGSSRYYKDGFRVLGDGFEVQRFLCRDCNFRYTLRHSNSKINSNLGIYNQIGAEKAKNLVAQKIKICADDKRLKPLSPENKGLIVKFQAFLDRNGFY